MTETTSEIYVVMKEFCGCDMPILVTDNKLTIITDGQKMWTLVRNANGDYTLEDYKQ